MDLLLVVFAVEFEVIFLIKGNARKSFSGFLQAAAGRRRNGREVSISFEFLNSEANFTTDPSIGMNTK